MKTADGYSIAPVPVPIDSPRLLALDPMSTGN